MAWFALALQIFLENDDFPLLTNMVIAAQYVMSDLTDYICSRYCGYQPYRGVTICEDWAREKSYSW